MSAQSQPVVVSATAAVSEVDFHEHKQSINARNSPMKSSTVNASNRSIDMLLSIASSDQKMEWESDKMQDVEQPMTTTATTVDAASAMDEAPDDSVTLSRRRSTRVREPAAKIVDGSTSDNNDGVAFSSKKKRKIEVQTTQTNNGKLRDINANSRASNSSSVNDFQLRSLRTSPRDERLRDYNKGLFRSSSGWPRAAPREKSYQSDNDDCCWNCNQAVDANGVLLELYLCNGICGRAFHATCHRPSIPSTVISSNAPFFCSTCSKAQFPTATANRNDVIKRTVIMCALEDYSRRTPGVYVHYLLSHFTGEALSLNYRDADRRCGFASLHYAIALNLPPGVILGLITKGADVNLSSAAEKATALHMAIHKCFVPGALALLTATNIDLYAKLSAFPTSTAFNANMRRSSIHKGYATFCIAFLAMFAVQEHWIHARPSLCNSSHVKLESEFAASPSDQSNDQSRYFFIKHLRQLNVLQLQFLLSLLRDPASVKQFDPQLFQFDAEDTKEIETENQRIINQAANAAAASSSSSSSTSVPHQGLYVRPKSIDLTEKLIVCIWARVYNTHKQTTAYGVSDPYMRVVNASKMWDSWKDAFHSCSSFPHLHNRPSEEEELEQIRAEVAMEAEIKDFQANPPPWTRMWQKDGSIRVVNLSELSTALHSPSPSISAVANTAAMSKETDIKVSKRGVATSRSHEPSASSSAAAFSSLASSPSRPARHQSPHSSSISVSNDSKPYDSRQRSAVAAAAVNAVMEKIEREKERGKAVEKDGAKESPKEPHHATRIKLSTLPRRTLGLKAIRVPSKRENRFTRNGDTTNFSAEAENSSAAPASGKQSAPISHFASDATSSNVDSIPVLKDMAASPFVASERAAIPNQAENSVSANASASRPKSSSNAEIVNSPYRAPSTAAASSSNSSSSNGVICLSFTLPQLQRAVNGCSEYCASSRSQIELLQASAPNPPAATPSPQFAMCKRLSVMLLESMRTHLSTATLLQLNLRYVLSKEGVLLQDPKLVQELLADVSMNFADASIARSMLMSMLNACNSSLDKAVLSLQEAIEQLEKASN